MKNFKETNLPHLTKGLIGNYHYGLYIEHAETRAWERPDSDLVVGKHINATKQAAGRERCPADFLAHVSKSNINNLERALKKFKASIGV